MSYYRDLRGHVAALEANGRLVRIKREINKDTEAIPIVRCQFRGLPEPDRKAFLFENVVDAKGGKFAGPLLVASYAASRDVYALGMKCGPDEINEKWQQAQLHPINPVVVGSGPVHEEVHIGEGLLEHHGLEEFPTPISTPGGDNAPYITGGCWVSKDPDTGVVNVGIHRAMIKSQDRTGLFLIPNQHLLHHWEKAKNRGRALEVALVIGASPNIGYVAAAKLPYDADEYAVAGGIAGEALEVVKCKTVGLEVPATAEVVLEGEVPIDVLEREGPFGEFHGYMGMETMSRVFNIRCITHRKKPVYNAIISEFPPSESTKLRQLALEGIFYKFLKRDCNIPGVQDVAFHEESGASGFCVIKMRKTHASQPWQALNAAAGLAPNVGKIIVAVDDDIDPRDLDSVVWAMCWRMQAAQDIRVAPGKHLPIDPSARQLRAGAEKGELELGSTLLVDATYKLKYPPVALPRREYMERACNIWEEEGLPSLKLKTPWYGYPLGIWSEENEAEARLATRGEHYLTGRKVAGGRVKIPRGE